MSGDAVPHLSAPEAAHPHGSAGSSRRRAVLVAGSGRSGTSTMSGALAALGLRVPQPEVQADHTNPRGFGEPSWVVGLHSDLLNRANVRVLDGRPDAAVAAAELVDEQTQRRLDSWLMAQFRDTGSELVVKDPRLLWFVPLWRSAALKCQAEPAVITMLRPVPEVAGSRQAYYTKSLGGDASTVAGWVNTMLTCEYATRGSRRAFVRYHDLLSDWRVPVTELVERFDLDTVRSASPDASRAVDAFIDPSLRRVQLTWDDLAVPTRLREIAEATWNALDLVVDATEDGTVTHRTLDELRVAYAEYYQECASVAHSTAVAAQRARTPAYKVSRRLPYGVRQAVRQRVPAVVRRMAGGTAEPPTD